MRQIKSTKETHTIFIKETEEDEELTITLAVEFACRMMAENGHRPDEFEIRAKKVRENGEFENVVRVKFSR